MENRETRRGFHILADETDNGYRIIIPEHPNADAVCNEAVDIIPVSMAAKEKDEADRVMESAVCPACGKAYTGYPAFSRKDNCTKLCPACGTMEALDAAGIGDDEKERILDEIHRVR